MEWNCSSSAKTVNDDTCQDRIRNVTGILCCLSLQEASLTTLIVSVISNQWFTDQICTDVSCLVSFYLPTKLKYSSLQRCSSFWKCGHLNTVQAYSDTENSYSSACLPYYHPGLKSVSDLQMVQHMFNCILLHPFHTGSSPLKGCRSLYTPTRDQTNIAIFISAEGNHCKGTDPAENRALIAVPLKPNVIATDKPHPKVHSEQTPVQLVPSAHQNKKRNGNLYIMCHACALIFDVV